MLKKLWLCGASCAAMMAATGAHAQVAGASPVLQTAPGLETVIVTATKVRANAQRVPIAIQTVAGRAVTAAGVDNAKDLSRLVSALSVQNSGGAGSSFYIRGVGTNNGNANTDSGVAVDLDQMYFSRQYGPDLVFYDIASIDVLKGPQGTLYGRNATGGVINIISTKPVIGKFDGYARLELGNYGEIRSNAAVNLPLSDTLAARFAMQTDEHNGYLTDGYDDNKNRAVRAHLLWKPNTDFSLLVSAEYDHAGGRGQEAVPFPNNGYVFSNPYTGNASQAGMAYISALAQLPGPFGSPNPNQGTPLHFLTAPGSCYPGCIPAGLIQPNANAAFHPYLGSTNGFVDVTVQSLRADMEWNLGPATLSVIPTLLDTHFSTLFYLGPPPFYQSGSARQQSLEARITSPQDQRLTWLAGVFGQQEKQNFAFLGAFGAPFAYNGSFEPDVEDRAGGIFAQSEFKILPTLALVAGARYSIENKISRNQDADNATLTPFIPPVHAVAPVNKEYSAAPTYRLGLNWQATPDNLLYASFATGFHSGGLQFGEPPIRPICKPVLNGTTDQFLASVQKCDGLGTFLPEKLKAYTIGSKNRFFDNRFQINLEAYDWEYTNLQVGTLGLSNPNQTNQVIQNAGSAKIRGFDVDARVQITPDDQAGISLNYNRSQYGFLQFYNFIVGSPFPPNISNFTGRPFVNAPELTFTANYSHVLNFASGATLTPAISAQYSSLITYSIAPAQTQPAYYKIDLNITYRSPKGMYEATVFVRNLNDVTTLAGGGGQDSATNLPYVYIAAPRTFGGSLQVNF